MLHLLFKDQPWFRVKRYGYGAGLPIKWQGWALLASYILTMGGVSLLADRPDAFSKVAVFGLLLMLTGALIVIAKKRTDGAWKWRNGEDN